MRTSEYLYQLKDGQLIYISINKNDYSYGSCKLFKGKSNYMREIPIKIPLGYEDVIDSAVVRYRDGGTTFIYTAEGILHSPSSFKQDGTSTWSTWGRDGSTAIVHDLQKLDPAKYNIVETGRGVQITKN